MALLDVSTPTPRLPIEPAKWDSMAFAKRCGAVRVGSHGLKAFYLALALQCQPLKRADVGVFRIRLTNMLHYLEIGERAFYRNRKALERQGLLFIRRTAKSTEVRVFARRMLAEAPPWSSDSVEVTESIDWEYRQDVPEPVGGKGSPTVAYSPTRAGGAGDDEFVFLPADHPLAFEADEGGD